MKLIYAADYRRMPWKNGGGETIEIAVSPDGATVSGFDWRISMARVEGDGPFSIFPGVDRTLAILEGAGLHLRVGTGAPLTLAKESAPCSFAADIATSARLIDGPVVDFNVMSRRSRCGHGLRRLEITEPTDIRVHGEAQVIFAALGAVRIADDENEAELAEGASLRTGDKKTLSVRPLSPTTLYLAEFSPVRAPR